MHDAFVVLLGEHAKGLSPNVISRLKAQWADERQAWAARSLRHHSARTKGCVSRSSLLGLAFKLVKEAERSWRRINAPARIAELLAGICACLR